MSVGRMLRTVWDAMWLGPAYGVVSHLLREPRPHDPEVLWELLNPDPPHAASWWDAYPPAWWRRRWLRALMAQPHRAGIEAHYDVSNDFYRLFLDREYMFYTCADFHSPDDSLEQAQINKANHLVSLIQPEPTERILELGCGWGAMLKRLEEERGTRDGLVGYTLSKEQVEYNRSHNGFDVRLVNFVTCEYEAESFDKIYSIGAWEHVRHADLGGLLPKLHLALKPGGRMVHHFICPHSDAVTSDVVVAQLFFPGSYIPGRAVQERAFEDAGFKFVHQSEHDYRPTLRAWFQRLAENRDEAIGCVGLSTYNRYLVFFAASHSYFDRGRASLVRWVLTR